MSVTANTIWRCRPGGSGTNGGGFDPTVASPGTNYATQDSAQVSYTDLVCGASSTLTSAANPFTSAHVGNVIAISAGTGFTTGRYTILSVSGSTATVSSSPGTVSSTGGTGSLGGGVTIAGTYGSDSTVPPFIRHLVPGNTIYILGVAGNAASYPTTSCDYTITGYTTAPNGSSSAGFIKWVADPGGPMPTISVNGLWQYNATWQWYEGLYLVASGASNGTLGVLVPSANSVTRSCVCNANSQASLVFLSPSAGEISDCELFGGSTTPTASTGADLVVPRGGGCVIVGNLIRHARGVGIDGSASCVGTVIVGNAIAGCAGDGIALNDSTAASGGVIAGNTINANGGHGINLVAADLIAYYAIHDNMLTNHAGTGKAGLYAASGTQAANDARKRLCDYNWFYNNTVAQGSGTNVSLGAHDTSGTDPGYAGASAYHFTPSASAAKTGGFPGVIRGTA